MIAINQTKEIICPPPQESFDSFFDAYLKYRSLHVRESSLTQAKTVRNKYLIEWAGKPFDQALNPKNVGDVYRIIAENETLCPAWKNRIFGVLKSMVTYAFKTKRIESSTYQDCMAIIDYLPENRFDKKEKQIWTPREEGKFLAAIVDENHKVMFRLFIELGARISEFLGLTWDCFDGRKGSITIKQQLLHNSQKTFVVSPMLKSNESYRTCRIDPELKNDLMAYRKRVGHNKGFMFRSPADDSMPLSKMAFRCLFKKYIRLSGVKRITPHAIRHARASKLLKACRNMLDVVAVARYMGHSPSMLMDTYSHSQESTINAIIKRATKN